MQKKSDFLKKVQMKSRKLALNLQKLNKESKSSHNSQQKNVQIRKENIAQFQFIGIFDKKVIVSFHNGLQMFGYFDFHAIHQRIRYEYYSWKLRTLEYQANELCPFDHEVVEKEKKTKDKEPYGQEIKILLRIDSKNLIFFKQNQKKVIVWGFGLERNIKNEIYVTSYRSILGKQFTNEEIIKILNDQLVMINDSKRKRIPCLIDQWIGEYSCKSAYKFNDNLSDDQAKLLIENLGRCQFPWYCVHGRNTVHIKTIQQLSL